MRKPVLIGIAAAAAATMFAGGVAYASGNRSADQPAGVQAHKIGPQAAIDTTTESKFIAIAPCRAVDTRRAGGDLNSDTTRNFRVGGATSFAGQGGPSAGCGLPTNPVAIAATITTVAHHNGYLKAWAAGATQPATSFLNYGTAVNASVGGIIPVSSGGVISVFNHGGPTDVILDITGYYVKPLFANVSSSGTQIQGSRTTGVTHIGTGFYEVDFDRDVSHCSYVASAFNTGVTVEVQPRSGNVDGVFIGVRDLTGTLVDQQFDLTVTC